MKNSINTAFFWCAVLFLVAFIPLLFLLGFGVSDDLSFVANIGSSFWNDLTYSLSRSGHISRPIYGLLQTSTLHLFREHYVYYNVFRILIWLAIITQSYRVFRYYFSANVHWLFLFFIGFPIFTSAHLFNSFQMGYLFSLLFYLFALRGIQDKNGDFIKENYAKYILLSILALFSCEIIFPLFILPLASNYFRDSKRRIQRNLLISTFFLFAIFFIHKFLIGPLYQIDSSIYGFSLSANSVLQTLYYFLVIGLEIPLLLIEVIPFYASEPVLYLSLLVIPLIYFVHKRNDFEFDKRRFLSLVVTLFACCFIFLLSNYPAVTFGLYNKMLLPTHLIYSILISMFCLTLLKSRFFIFTYIICVLWFASMEMQIVNSIRSWNEREVRLKQIVGVLNSEDLTNQYIFVEVPYFLKSNYNNEHVFALNDDFHGGIDLYGYDGNSRQVFPFCSKMVHDEEYFSNHNINLVIRQNNLGQFKLIRNGHLSKEEFTLNTLKKISLHQHKECFRSRLRSLLIQKIRTP